MRGRKPTPTALKIVRGNPGKRALPENEPEPKGEAVAPDWLSPAAAQHWSTVARQLEDAGLLTSMDAAALALYCEGFARWQDANALIANTGVVVLGQNGTLTQNPAVHIANAVFDQMRKMLLEFGMTPSSRKCVSMVPTDDADRYAAFVKKPSPIMGGTPSLSGAPAYFPSPGALTESGYSQVTDRLKSKKPGRDDRAKCLNLLVGRE
jgi:P27 family predicted phage terminase small subunit